MKKETQLNEGECSGGQGDVSTRSENKCTEIISAMCRMVDSLRVLCSHNARHWKFEEQYSKFMFPRSYARKNSKTAETHLKLLLTWGRTK